MYLSKDEIDDFEQEIKELESLIFSQKLPRITPKCQLLLRHVVPFMRRHFLWGKASEQPIENLHSKINEDLKRLSAIKQKEDLYFQLIETTCIHNYIFDA